MNSFIQHLRLAAEAGAAGAQFNLGVIYDNALDDNGHGVERDRQEAIKWFRKAAQQGLARAQAKLADMYAEQSDLKHAYAWFKVAAENSRGADGQRIHDRMDRILPLLSEAQIDSANKLACRLTSAIRGLR